MDMIGKILNNLKFSSFSKDAFITTPYSDDYILRGNGFSLEYVFDVGSGDNAFDLVFDTSAFTRSALVAYPTIWNVSKGHGIVTLGVCDSYSGGTEVTPTNRNSAFASLWPAQTVFKYDVTPTNFVAAPTKILVGTEASPVASGGGLKEGKLPIWLSTGLRYVFRFDNRAGDDIVLGTAIYWYEF